VAQGVSPKSNPSFFSDKVSYNWTNAMFSWQRTAYHFQPEKNWMNGRCNINSSLHFSFPAINGR
jgi:beta-fructofuranosidase